MVLCGIVTFDNFLGEEIMKSFFGSNGSKRRKVGLAVPAQMGEMLEPRALLHGGWVEYPADSVATETSQITSNRRGRNVELDLTVYSDSSDITGEIGTAAFGASAASISGDVRGWVKVVQATTSVSQQDVVGNSGRSVVVHTSSSVYIDIRGTYSFSVDIGTSVIMEPEATGALSVNSDGSVTAHFEGRGKLTLSMSVYTSYTVTEGGFGSYETANSTGSYYVSGGRIISYSVHMTSSLTVSDWSEDDHGYKSESANAYLSVWGKNGQGSQYGFVSSSWDVGSTGGADQEEGLFRNLSSNLNLSGGRKMPATAYGSVFVYDGTNSKSHDVSVDWPKSRQDHGIGQSVKLPPIHNGTDENIWKVIDAAFMVRNDLGIGYGQSAKG